MNFRLEGRIARHSTENLCPRLLRLILRVSFAALFQFYPSSQPLPRDRAPCTCGECPSAAHPSRGLRRANPASASIPLPRIRNGAGENSPRCNGIPLFRFATGARRFGSVPFARGGKAPLLHSSFPAQASGTLRFPGGKTAPLRQASAQAFSTPCGPFDRELALPFPGGF